MQKNSVDSLNLVSFLEKKPSDSRKKFNWALNLVNVSHQEQEKHYEMDGTHCRGAGPC